MTPPTYSSFSMKQVRRGARLPIESSITHPKVLTPKLQRVHGEWQAGRRVLYATRKCVFCARVVVCCAGMCEWGLFDAFFKHPKIWPWRFGLVAMIGSEIVKFEKLPRKLFTLEDPLARKC